MGSKASRNTSIEALRLVAVAGIAVFHTFQWTFQAVCTGVPEYASLAVSPCSGALGFINLLGLPLKVHAQMKQAHPEAK